MTHQLVWKNLCIGYNRITVDSFNIKCATGHNIEKTKAAA